MFWLQLNFRDNSNSNSISNTITNDILKNAIVIGDMDYFPEKMKKDWIVIDNMMKNGKSNRINR